MKRILFVDDEPRVLDGLRDLFRKQRKEWDMVFAPGGPEGIAALDSDPFDVIVTDMRMPLVDGNEVLHAARDKQPAAVRIVLSGHAGQEAELAALTVAHQFVSKPCDPATLKAILGRAFALADLIANEALRRAVGELEALPAVPQLYLDLSSAAADPNVSAARLAGLVERDAAMAAKLLQLANSAAFGSASPHVSIRQSIVYLGVQRLKALVLSTQIFSARRPTTGPLDLAAEQRHAERTAALAHRLVRVEDRDLAFTAGLLHDVGRIVLATCAPDAFAAAMQDAAASGRSECEVEAERLGISHAQAGAYLLALWGLPLSIVEAVHHHETPEAHPSEVVVCVHAADVLAGDPTGARLRHAFLDDSPFADRVPAWRQIAAA